MRLAAGRLAFAAGLLAAGLLTATSAGAASPRPKGITVSPAYQQVSIPQGAASVPLKFMVTNHEAKAETISLSTRDFNTLSETGGLFFVGSNPTQLQKRYGLAKWLSLPQKQVTVQPGRTAAIDASILNLPSLAPGGHYGALMLSLGGGTAGGNVSLHPIASSLLFVTKLGGDTHQLALAGVTAKHNLFNLPASVVLNFHNAGNSHVVPRGVVTIAGPDGNLISKGIINQNSDIILPQNFRLIEVPLSRVSNARPIGKYTLRVDFRLDGYNQYRRYQAGFWLVEWYVFVVIALLIIITALAIKGRKNLRSWR